MHSMCCTYIDEGVPFHGQNAPVAHSSWFLELGIVRVGILLIHPMDESDGQVIVTRYPADSKTDANDVTFHELVVDLCGRNIRRKVKKPTRVDPMDDIVYFK